MSTTRSAASADVRTAREHLVRGAEQRIHRLLAAEVAKWSSLGHGSTDLVAAVQRMMDAGGKRLRPAFCVAGYLAAGGDPERADEIVDAAAAVELLHVFALIHDDVLDNSPVRRGVETIHVTYGREHQDRGLTGDPRRYGEGVAILAGDLSHAYADGLAARLPAAAREVWAELRAEMIVGQFMDVRAAAESLMDTGLARWIAVCKSGHYTIHRPLALGAAVAGRTDLDELFRRYGTWVGEAFQLRDDLIDLTGDSAVTGKPTGQDTAGYKMTLLLTLAAERDHRVRDLVRRPGRDRPAAADLHTLLRESGVAVQVEHLIGELVGKASALLHDAPLPPPWRAELIEMAHHVAYRDR
ncbi:polyprenyl synthetase family protein [Actinomadura sp. KC216]|uniref:polyprenyl synthetase family protein n=1 Tax=Actinomadura sp. KC216 TaxID=2530370 RepID=UPI00104D719C|nr:polyprenyl synthetase family protein [Actinomadura sp. KC216]TDB90709.1 polyprenyl synthetase family protein [Actinomadura sp. KC216]